MERESRSDRTKKSNHDKIKNRNRNKSLVKVIIFLALVGVLSFIIYVVPRFGEALEATYIVEYGTLSDTVKTQGVVARTEQTVTTDYTGELEKLATEETVVMQGTTVATVGGNNIYAPIRGVVAYGYDGYEGELNGESLANLEKSFIENYRNTAADSDRKSNIEGSLTAGDICFKIFDNWEWYMVCWLPADYANDLYEGEDATVRFKDVSVDMEVMTLIQEGDDTKVLFRCNNDCKGFGKFRVENVEISFGKYSGLILEKSSLT